MHKLSLCPDNMISDAEPVWDEAAFTPFGKWMDGWESRRRRTEGHDWCVLQLGLPGVIKAIEVDTGTLLATTHRK